MVLVCGRLYDGFVMYFVFLATPRAATTNDKNNSENDKEKGR